MAQKLKYYTINLSGCQLDCYTHDSEWLSDSLLDRGVYFQNLSFSPPYGSEAKELIKLIDSCSEEDLVTLEKLYANNYRAVFSNGSVDLWEFPIDLSQADIDDGLGSPRYMGNWEGDYNICLPHMWEFVMTLIQ